MSQILTQPKYFELESAAFICSLRLKDRMQYALSGGFAVTLTRKQEAEPPMADHIEFLVDSNNLALAEAIFQEDTEVNKQQVLDVLDEKLIVNIYKISQGPRAVVVKFVPLGQQFYPWQLTFGDDKREPTIYPLNVRILGETKEIRVLTPKYLLYHLVASFHLPPVSATDDNELNSKRSTYTQINVCLEAAASLASEQTTDPLRQLYKFDLVQAAFLRERVLALIEYACHNSCRFTAVQINQWASLGVAMTEEDLSTPVGNNNMDEETWYTAWDGM